MEFDSKKEFVEIYNALIKRDGADKLLDYLLTGCDFFTAPASTKFHLSYAGGLAEHSVNVYKRLLKLIKAEYGDNYAETYSDETIAICGLLHDLCKTDFYKIDFRNVKENDKWVSKPYYTIDEKLPYGHGEKSVYIIYAFMPGLKREEAIAINWHMGGFDDRVRGGNMNSLASAFGSYPLAMLLHIADMMATYLDEDR